MCDRAVGEDSIPKQQLGPEASQEEVMAGSGHATSVVSTGVFGTLQDFLLRMVNCELQDTSKTHC